MPEENKISITPRKIKIGAALTLLILFLYLTRPLWHWLFFNLLWIHSIHIIGIVLLLFLAVNFFLNAEKKAEVEDGYFTRTKSEPDWGQIIAGLVSLLAVFLFIFWSFDSYGKALAFSFEPEPVGTQIPDTGQRYWPYEVALDLMKSQQQERTKKVCEIDPIIINDEFYWVSPRVPNGIWNWLTQKTDAILLLNERGELKPDMETFQVGQGMGFFDGIWWQIRAKRYAARYPEIFYVPKPEEEGWLAIAPYITFRLAFPSFVPQWGGVMVINPNGEIEDLSPQEAYEDHRLQGYRIFPENLAKLKASRWGYRYGGLLNVLFSHKEDLDIADLSNTKNDMPYFLPTSWGPQWMVAANPSGPSNSIFKIFWFDVRTGNTRLTEFDPQTSLIGPNSGKGYVRSETPGYTWRDSEEGGTYLAIEARPLVKEGTLYWIYAITTDEYSGVGLTALLDSRNSERVLHFCSRQSFYDWQAGKSSSDSLPCTTRGEEALHELEKGESKKCQELWRQLREATEREDASAVGRLSIQILDECR